MTPKQQEMLEIKAEVGERVVAEFWRQQEKWGDQFHNPAVWHLIVAEEWGEVAKATVEALFETDSALDKEDHWSDVMTEIVETIACLLHMYHEAKRQRDHKGHGFYGVEDPYTP